MQWLDEISPEDSKLREAWIQKLIAGSPQQLWYYGFLEDGRLDLLDEQGNLRPVFDITSRGKADREPLHPLPPEAYPEPQASELSPEDTELRIAYIKKLARTAPYARHMKWYESLLDEGRLDLLNEDGTLRSPISVTRNEPVPLYPLPLEAHPEPKAQELSLKKKFEQAGGNDEELRIAWIRKRMAVEGDQRGVYANYLEKEKRLDLLDERGMLRSWSEIGRDRSLPEAERVLHPLPAAAYEMWLKEHAPAEAEAATGKPQDRQAALAAIREQLKKLPPDDFMQQFIPGLLMTPTDELMRTGGFIIANGLKEEGPAFLLNEDGTLKDIGVMGFTPQAADIAYQKGKEIDKAKSFTTGAEILEKMRNSKERTYDVWGKKETWPSLLPLRIKKEFLTAIAKDNPDDPKLPQVVQELIDRQTDPDKFKDEKLRTRTRRSHSRMSFGGFRDNFEYEEEIDPFESGMVYIAKALGVSNKRHEWLKGEVKVSLLDQPLMVVLSDVLKSLDQPMELETSKPKKVIVEAARLQRDPDRKLPIKQVSAAKQAEIDALIAGMFPNRDAKGDGGPDLGRK